MSCLRGRVSPRNIMPSLHVMLTTNIRASLRAT
jgi:hypothetical protein